MVHTCCSGVSGVSYNCPLEGGCQDYSQQASQPVACEFEQPAASPSSLYAPGALEQTVLKTTEMPLFSTWRGRYWQRKNYAVFRLVPDQHLTRVVGQCAALAILGRGYEVPNEALDVLVSTVVEQAVGQECTADGLYVSLPQWALKASMGQDVTPAAPAMHNRREVSQSKYSMWKLQFVSFQLFLKFKPFRTTVVWFCNEAWGKKKKSHWQKTS